MIRTTAFVVTLLLAATVVAAVVGGVLLSREFTQAAHGTTQPSMAFDAVISDNTYTFVLDASTNTITRNEINVGSVTPCTVVNTLGGSGAFGQPPPHQFDIVGGAFTDMVFFDIRINYDPNLVVIDGFNSTPFAGPVGDLGFINLPIDISATPPQRAHSAAPDIDNAGGTAFFADTYQGSRSFFFSPDQPHTHSATEPYQANDGWVVLARVSMHFKPAADGQVVSIDLSNTPTPGSDYGSFDGSFIEEIVPVPESNLFDGQIAVAPATCPAPESTQPPKEQTAAPAPAARSLTPTPINVPSPLTPTGGDAGSNARTEEQIEKLTEETIQRLIEEAEAGNTSLSAVLDIVTAGGSTDVLAICADENANALPGVDITFRVDQQPGSDANLDGQAEVTKTSEAAGIAQATLNVGNTSGEIVVSATAEECNTKTTTVTIEATASGPVPARGATIGDDGGSGVSIWQLVAYTAAGFVLLTGGVALIWRWRRRSR